jgi:hypothetical protein
MLFLLMYRVPIKREGTLFIRWTNLSLKGAYLMRTSVLYSDCYGVHHIVQQGVDKLQ